MTTGSAYAAAVMAVSFLLPTALSSEGWESNVEVAERKASEEGKGILFYFTRSDRCPPCIQLKREVLVKDEFLKPAREHFVLVELDFPLRGQTPEQNAYNDRFFRQYAISGFPTLVFADQDGRPVNSFVGGRDMELVMKEVDAAIEARSDIPERISRIKSLQGNDKFKAIGELADKITLRYLVQFYPDLADELKNDTDDASGYAAQLGGDHQRSDFDLYMDGMKGKLGANPDPASMQSYIEDYLNKTELVADVRQKALSYVAVALYSQVKIDEAIAKLDEAIECFPTSKLSDELKDQKRYLETNKQEIVETSEAYRRVAAFKKSLDRTVLIDPARFERALEGLLEDEQLTGMGKQVVMSQIVPARVAQGKVNEALVMIREAISLAPDSTVANRLVPFMEELSQYHEEMVRNFKASWETNVMED